MIEPIVQRCCLALVEELEAIKTSYMEGIFQRLPFNASGVLRHRHHEIFRLDSFFLVELVQLAQVASHDLLVVADRATAKPDGASLAQLC